MTKPFNNLAQICWKPEYQDIITDNCGWREIFSPFIGFILFILGKLLVVIFALVVYNKACSDLLKKPFTVYYIVAYYFLGSLGLHIYLTIQEFIFYYVNNHHGKFVRYFLETPEEKLKRSENDQRLPLDLSTTICFHEAVVDLLEIMKSVIEMFGPFLLQNLSLMLVYWLLHVYNVAFLGALMLKTINKNPDGQTIFMQGLALAGSALVIG